jgi:hypothetical protein
LLFAEVQQAENKGAKHGLGMLPADGIEGTVGVGNEDRLVADVAVVAGSVAPQQLEDLAGAVVAGKSNRCPLGPLRIPGFHGRRELSGSPFWSGKRPTQRLHGIVPCRLTRVAFLGALEVVQRIEKRQQTQVGGSFEAENVSRMDDENAVQCESRRAGIDVANSS